MNAAGKLAQPLQALVERRLRALDEPVGVEQDGGAGDERDRRLLVGWGTGPRRAGCPRGPRRSRHRRRARSPAAAGGRRSRGAAGPRRDRRRRTSASPSARPRPRARSRSCARGRATGAGPPARRRAARSAGAPSAPRRRGRGRRRRRSRSPRGRREARSTSYQSPPTCASAAPGHVAGGELEPGQLGKPLGQEAALERLGDRGDVLDLLGRAAQALHRGADDRVVASPSGGDPAPPPAGDVCRRPPRRECRRAQRRGCRTARNDRATGYGACCVDGLHGSQIARSPGERERLAKDWLVRMIERTPLADVGELPLNVVHRAGAQADRRDPRRAAARQRPTAITSSAPSCTSRRSPSRGCARAPGRRRGSRATSRPCTRS